MKNKSIYVIKSIAILLFSAAMGIVLLVAAFAIPDSAVQANLARSAGQFHDAYIRNENLQKNFPWWHLQEDFFEDEIILLQADYAGNEQNVTKAVMIFNNSVSSVGHPGSLWAHYTDGKEYDTKDEYLRYWHGYLILLRPLLAFFDYDHIIFINAIIQIMSTIILCCFFWKKGLKDMIVPYLIGYGILMPVISWQTIQYSSCFYIMTIACLLILLSDERKNATAAPFIFLVTGILLAYFDLLTYPVITLAVPMAVYLRRNIGKDITAQLKNIVINSFMWGTGYIGMWFGKGLVTKILMPDINVFGILIENIKHRTSNSSETGGTFSFGEMLYLNVRRFINSPFILVAFAFFVFCFARMIIRIKNKQLTIKEILPIVLIFAIVAIMPFAWYFVTINHSSIHCWYTNKAMVGSVFAILGVISWLSRMEQDDQKKDIIQTEGEQ